LYLHEVGKGTSLNREEWMARMKEAKREERKVDKKKE
jgi:hypothetical protein